MVIVIAIAIAVGLVGGWVYAGLPGLSKPAAARKPESAERAGARARVPGASTARS
jgi:hypothetical protein